MLSGYRRLVVLGMLGVSIASCARFEKTEPTESTPVRWLNEQGCFCVPPELLEPVILDARRGR